MSEVKRYDMCGFGGGLVESKEGAWYHFEDFDRVTAERDALQQLLNVADERADKNATIAVELAAKECVLGKRVASLEQRHRAEFEACQAAERRVEVLQSCLEECITEMYLALEDHAVRSAMTVIGRTRFLELVKAHHASLNPTAEGASHE